MKYIPVSRDVTGAVIPYAYYNASEARYKLAEREMVEEAIELVFDLEVIPSTFIPVGVTQSPRIVEATPASEFFGTMMSIIDSGKATYVLDRNESGLIQVYTLIDDGLKQIHCRTAFVNPDCLMEDDAYIPYAVGADFIELRRMMATNPINI